MPPSLILRTMPLLFPPNSTRLARRSSNLWWTRRSAPIPCWCCDIYPRGARLWRRMGRRRAGGNIADRHTRFGNDETARDAMLGQVIHDQLHRGGVVRPVKENGFVE